MTVKFPVKVQSLPYRKASPGRGKLSPQVTDEGAPFAATYGESPLIRRYAPPSPQGVKALAAARFPVKI